MMLMIICWHHILFPLIFGQLTVIGLINVFCQSKEARTDINVFCMPFMMTILCLLLKGEDKMETGYFDDNGKSIYVGDRLKSEWGYEVIVEMIDGEYVGKLVCDENHSCKDIPYSLNKGKGCCKVEEN